MLVSKWKTLNIFVSCWEDTEDIFILKEETKSSKDKKRRSGLEKSGG